MRIDKKASLTAGRDLSMSSVHKKEENKIPKKQENEPLPVIKEA